MRPAPSSGAGFVGTGEPPVLDVSVELTGQPDPVRGTDVTVTVHNPNRHDVTVTDIVGDVLVGNLFGCDPLDEDLPDEDLPVGDLDPEVGFTDRHLLRLRVPANATTTVTLTGALWMSGVSGVSGEPLHAPLVVTATGVADLSPTTPGGGLAPVTGTGMLFVQIAGSSPCRPWRVLADHSPGRTPSA